MTPRVRTGATLVLVLVALDGQANKDVRVEAGHETDRARSVATSSLMPASMSSWGDAESPLA